MMHGDGSCWQRGSPGQSGPPWSGRGRKRAENLEAGTTLRGPRLGV